MTKIFSVQEVLNVDNCDCATINMYGYFFKEIPIDLEIPEGQDAYELKVINSLNDNCFGFVPSSSKNSKTKRAKFFPYFIPVNSVYKKSEFRPFKDFKEFFKKIDNILNDDIDIYSKLGVSFTYRHKESDERSEEVVTSLKVNVNQIYFLNGLTFQQWFENYDLLINGYWEPFGVADWDTLLK